MKTLVTLCALLCLTAAGIAETRGTHYTHEQLHKMSTLVFKGVVTKIRTVEKYEKIFPVGAVASKVLKGELSETRIGFTHKHPGRCVIFREEFNTPRVGQEGTFFLQNQGGTLVLIGYIKIEQD